LGLGIGGRKVSGLSLSKGFKTEGWPKGEVWEGVRPGFQKGLELAKGLIGLITLG